MKLLPGIHQAAVVFFALPFLLFSQSTPEKKVGPTVNGTAMYRERVAMQPDAVFEATLEDVSKVDSPPDIISTARIENPGNPPYDFSLSYDPSKIVEDHSYSVRVTIKVDGKLIFTSTEAYLVITRGSPQEVDILLHSVAPSGSSPASSGSAPHPTPRYALEGTDWKLTRLGDAVVIVNPDQPEPSVVLSSEDHRVAGSGGCNRMMGTYQLDGQSLRFGALATTRMACVSGMDQESSFLEALLLVRTWKIKGRHLELFGEDDKLIAQFVARDKK